MRIKNMSNANKTFDPADVTNAELIAAEKIAVMHESAGLEAPASFPMDTSAVLAFFQKLDYRVDGDFILGLCNSGILAVPSKAGHRQWNPLSVFMLFTILEGRRRWLPTKRHLHKMTVLEREQALAEQDGRTVIDDLDQYDIEQLALMLEEVEDRNVRHFLRVALITKLRQQGAL